MNHWQEVIYDVSYRVIVDDLDSRVAIKRSLWPILNKKDGYRQQNVRQRQKLISIIDYDVCILEYLQPFWRYSTSKNGLTLKSGYGVLQGHWKMRDSIDHVWLSISPSL